MKKLRSIGNCDEEIENGHDFELERRHAPRSGLLRFLVDNLFLVSNIVGIVIGFVLGLLVRSTDIGSGGILWLGLPGELYMRTLKCIVIPLIVCSVIDGTANTDPRTNGKLGLVSFTYMVISNSVGAFSGMILAILLRPGSGLQDEEAKEGVDTRHLTTMDIVADFIRNIFPPNMIGAALQTSQTKYEPKDVIIEVNVSGQLVNQTVSRLEKSLGTVGSTNILGLIVISASLGIAASQSGLHAKPFLAFFKAGATIIFKLFNWIKWMTPLGSASLIASALVKVDNLGSAFRSMGVFSLIMVGCNLVLLQCILLSGVFFLVRRQNPVKLFLHGARAWFVAFGSINSTIPYPEYVTVLEQKFHVDTRVVEYVLPLCITLNRCGSATFITATCVFTLQYTGTAQGAGNIFIICVLTILSSLALPAVNSSSVVTVVIILETLGVSTTEVVGLVMTMEWLNDRVRTTTNAMSHMMCILTTWRLCKKSFTPVPSGEPDDVTSSL